MNVAGPSKIEKVRPHLNESAGPKPAPKGFSGEVLCHDISEIIRSISLSKLGIALVIKDGNKDGKIIFKGGEIVASICGELRGRRALSAIMSWKRGYFTLYRIFDGILCPE